MRHEEIPDQVLLDAWPKLSYSELYDLEKRGVDDIGHRSYRLRQRLVDAVRRSDLPDRVSRMELAMGNLKLLDQNSQKSWWDFVAHDLELVGLATKRGLHTGYMLPRDTGRYLDAWLEAGGGMHKAAQMMWDHCFLVGSQFHLETILTPRVFNAEHREQWRDRALASWKGACVDAKRLVFDQMGVHATAPISPALPDYASRKKWTMAWLDDLLDDSLSTHEAIRQWLVGPVCRGGVDAEIEGALRSHIAAKVLEVSTTQVAPRSKGPRL